ncbi:hypothetical protein [Actinoplanes sp. NPDC048796]|uniref:hypothetical protein n=1 Tax=Actinoplanes sp. NPDC048796 TaxID=3155640 RepID=UPI0033C2F1A1
MSLEWILPLAEAGGTAVAAAAGTEAWKMAREGIGRLFGRDDAKRAALTQRRLDESAAEVERASVAERDTVRSRQRVIWQTRLADLIEEEPAVADELRTLITQLGERLPAEQNLWVMHVTAGAPNSTAQGVQGGNIINH